MSRAAPFSSNSCAIIWGSPARRSGATPRQCGACTVLVDGESVKSCTMLGVQADGLEITTIEGLARNGELHAVQQAFHVKLGSQCGYCTPGYVMAAEGLLRRNPNPSEGEIKAALGSNICRCTGYVKIIEAVRYAADKLAAPAPAGGAA